MDNQSETLWSSIALQKLGILPDDYNKMNPQKKAFLIASIKIESERRK